MDEQIIRKETSTNQMQIDRESDVSSSSDEEQVEDELIGKKRTANSISIRFDLGRIEHAEIVYNALVVDKEPKRSRSRRKIELDGSYIVAEITSDCPKSLMKTANNFFDMCQLSRNCIDIIGNYEFKPEVPVVENNGKKKKGKKIK